MKAIDRIAQEIKACSKPPKDEPLGGGAATIIGHLRALVFPELEEFTCEFMQPKKITEKTPERPPKTYRSVSELEVSPTTRRLGRRAAHPCVLR